MRAKLTPEVTGKLIAAAQRKWADQNKDGTYHFAVGRLLFTRRCCQTRMVQVKSFYVEDDTLPYSASNRLRSDDTAICPVCTKAIILYPVPSI